jgi:hypothetical protein
MGVGRLAAIDERFSALVVRIAANYVVYSLTR